MSISDSLLNEKQCISDLKKIEINSKAIDSETKRVIGGRQFLTTVPVCLMIALCLAPINPKEQLNEQLNDR